MVLEKTLESPLDCKDIKPVSLKGNQSWIFIGRTDAKAEAPIIWPPDVKNWLTGKDPDAEKDLRQEVNGMTEDEMVGWHHQLDGHEFEQAPGAGDGQGKPGVLQSMRSQSWTWLRDWTEAQHRISTQYYVYSPINFPDKRIYWRKFSHERKKKIYSKIYR